MKPPKVFIMDTWAYPYRTPVFEKLAEHVNLELFFSKPIPRTHLSKVSISQFGDKVKSGKLLLAYTPIHLLWRKYDVYLVGQIGIESVLGAYLTMLMAKLYRKPLVLWTDYVETPHYIKTKPYKRYIGDRIRKVFTSQCTAAMAFGKYTADYLKKLTRGKLKIFEVKQIVPEICNHAAVKKSKDKQYVDKCILFCISYFQERKGLDFLIETFKELNDDNAILILAGTGKDKQRLQTLASDSNNIEFCGYLDAQGKAEYFTLADIFVFTSDHDPWGLVVNEAMYYGLPVIVTSSCGSYELISDNGIVIPPRDKAALKQALRRLIADPALRATMGNNSKAYISRYGLDYGVSSFLRVIEYAISSSDDCT